LFSQLTIKLKQVMKKFSVIIAALVLFAGVSFGQDKAPAKQTAPKKDVKASDTKSSKGSKGAKASEKATDSKKAAK
jgi:hypothetical protein